MSSPFTIWENEFFNRSVGPVYRLRLPLLGALPESQALLDPRSGFFRDDQGLPIRASYVLIDASVALAGTPVAVDPGAGMLLYRIAGREGRGRLRSMIGQPAAQLEPCEKRARLRNTYRSGTGRTSSGCTSTLGHGDPSSSSSPTPAHFGSARRSASRGPTSTTRPS